MTYVEREVQKLLGNQYVLRETKVVTNDGPKGDKTKKGIKITWTKNSVDSKRCKKNEKSRINCRKKERKKERKRGHDIT